MKREYVVIAFFLLLASIICYLTYRIVVPFLVPLCWAVVLTIMFYPLYDWTLKRVRRPSVAALIMCVLIVVLVIGPLTYLGIELVGQASDALARINGMIDNDQLHAYIDTQLPKLALLKEKLSVYVDFSKIDLADLIKGSFDKGSGMVVNQTSMLIVSGARAIIYFIMMLFSLFYLFRDGRRVVAYLERLMPLSAIQTVSAFARLRDVINATMYSSGAVAILQGVLGGLIFWIAGVSSPIFWGAVMAFMSVLPVVGSAVVYLPAGLMLVVGGHPAAGVILIGACALTMFQVDHFVRPLLVSGKTSIHPLVLFYSIAGGILFFGLVGLVMGPLVAAVFVSLLEAIDRKFNPMDPTVVEACGPGGRPKAVVRADRNLS
jgi:predicted PurR-regulated permease PerM